MRVPSLAATKASATALHPPAQPRRHVVELLLERRLDGELGHEALRLALHLDAHAQLRAALLERHAAGELLPHAAVADLGEADAAVVLRVEVEGGLALLAEQLVDRLRGTALAAA